MILEGLRLCQDNRDAQTGLLDHHKARFSIDGSIKIRKRFHPDPSVNYCNTLRPKSLDTILSVAAFYFEQISKGDSKSAFQHTPSTRAKPDVVWILKEVSGAAIDQVHPLSRTT